MLRVLLVDNIICLQTTIGLSTALSRAGTSSTPGLVKGINSANEITVRVVRLGICTLICPLQNGKEKESCQNENCGKADKRTDTDSEDSGPIIEE